MSIAMMYGFPQGSRRTRSGPNPGVLSLEAILAVKNACLRGLRACPAFNVGKGPGEGILSCSRSMMIAIIKELVAYEAVSKGSPYVRSLSGSGVFADWISA